VTALEGTGLMTPTPEKTMTSNLSAACWTNRPQYGRARNVRRIRCFGACRHAVQVGDDVRPNGSLLDRTIPHERYRQPAPPTGARSNPRNQRLGSQQCSPAGGSAPA
jgi:hypothetical protein